MRRPNHLPGRPVGLALAAALLVAPPALAQIRAGAPTLTETPASVQPSAERVTLADALEQALARQPDVLAARADLRRAQAETTIASGVRLPRVSFTESWQRSDQPVFAFSTLLAARRFTAADFAVDRLNQPGAMASFASRIGIGQMLFDGGRSSAAVAAARARRGVAVTMADEVAAQLTVDVTRAYARILTLDASVRATTAAVEAAREDQARATRRRDVGTVTESDVLAVSVHLADVEQRLLQATGELAIAHAELNRLRGAPVTTSVAVEWPAPARLVSDAADPASLDLPALVARAHEGRPDVRRAEAERRVVEAQARQSKAVWWPEASAQAGYEWVGLSVADRSGSWMVGGELRWTLSISGADRARMRAADDALDAMRSREAAVRARAEVDVISAVRRLEAARAREAVGTNAVAQAAESLRIIRNRYAAGLASITDVLGAAAAHLDADARRALAATDGLVALAELQRAVGSITGVVTK